MRAGSAEAIPYPPGYFDIATAFETLYFWPDLDGAFAEVLRALKPGGTFLIANHQADPERAEWADVVDNMTVYGEAEITARLARAGFAEITVRRSEKGWLCVIAKKPELRG